MNRLRLSAVEAHLPCGKIEFCHHERLCASSAYELKEKLAAFKLYVPRCAATSVASVTLYDQSLGNALMKIDGEWIDIFENFDVYSFEIPLSQLSVGLYFLRPEIRTFSETLYAHKSATDVYFNTDASLLGLQQLTVADFEYDEPARMYGGIIYHIFVDRFARGGKAEIPDYSELVSGEWDKMPEYPEYPGAPLKNNTLYGGTLWGIADKLDYIESLGATAIYLSPIFLSVSNHKYDTADYMRVDPAFGGDEAFLYLLCECKKRNIQLILDGVFNHTGADSVYFNRYGRFDKVGAYQSKESPYYGWYDFKSHPDKYTSWWDIEILPRINPDLLNCREYFVGKDGVIAKYRDMGVYGFRLDVADELSDDFISKIKDVLSADGESVLYGEVWEDASNKIAYDKRKRYYLGSELDGVMNYPVRTGIINYIKDRDLSALRYALCEVLPNAPDRIMHAQMNLLGTHDTERILTVLGGEPADGHTNSYLRDKRMTKTELYPALQRLIGAYTVLATLPGVPAIFYGDEAGLEGYSDPFNRMPYPWGRENKRLIKHYRAVGSMRKKHSVYKRGAFKLHLLDPDILVFSRDLGEYSYFTVYNNSDTSINVAFVGESCTMVLGKAPGTLLDPISAHIYKVKNAKEIIISEAKQ